jgi:hypothetical protein
VAGLLNGNPVHTARWHVKAGQILSSPFRDGEEIGPRMLARIAKNTGLLPQDL